MQQPNWPQCYVRLLAAPRTRKVQASARDATKRYKALCQRQTANAPRCATAMPEAVAIELALSRLTSAADNADELAWAIEKAAFLDDQPGDNRQKLRAARTKLKKLHKERASREAAAASKSLAERSPHTKETYDATEGDTLAKKYDKLNWRIISKPGGATVRPDDFYNLYGYHMQATRGDNDTERPMWAEKGGLDFEGRARWDAWTAVKGMSQSKAMLQFVKSYYEFPAKALYTDTR